MINSASNVRKRRRQVAWRHAFTLFELILAVALSVTLVALIGTAINLYLTRVDASRTEVEEAQLARSILAMIADDMRATAIYKPQDVSAIQQLQAASAEFDVDSIDDKRPGIGGGGGGGSGGGGASSSGGAPSSGMGGRSGSGGGSSMGSGSGTSSGGGMSSMGGGVSTTDSTMPLGLTGSLLELYVDTTRLPRREELFATVTGYTNAPIGVSTSGLAASSTMAAAASTAPRPSDLKSVRYFVRPGEAIAHGSAAATSLVGEQQLRAGGLVRQEIPRSMRVWAEQSGNSTILDSGQSLIAPEVVRIEFRYFDGAQITEVWEMAERNSLPVAIEVRLWIAPAAEAANINMAGAYNVVNLATTAREYRQTVYLPMAQLANSAMGGMSSGSGTGGSSSGGASSGGSSSGGSSSGSSSGGSGSQFGSGFGQQ